MGKASLLSTNPILSQEWHPTRNGLLTPSAVTPGSGKKVWWLCKKSKAHEWKTSISNRTHGYGCPYCTNRLVNSTNSLSTLFPEIAKEWHTNNNGSLTPNDVTPGSQKRVWWRCKKDNSHEWATSINNRTHGYGCPYCTNRLVNSQNSLATLFPKIAKDWHPTKNGSLTPNDVVFGSARRVWWLCKRNSSHEWKTSVNSRTCGTGCPFCHSSTSQPELRILAELSAIFDKIEHRKKFQGIECDIFLPEVGIAIEVDGRYWHEDKQELDKRKNDELKKLGISLIRIRDKGLQQISEFDVVHKLEPFSVATFKNILNAITKIKKVDNISAKRIELYMGENKFKKDTDYNKLLDRLPSPLPNTSLLELNPKLASEWHQTKNGTLTPADVALQSNKKVWWSCKKDKTHEWKAIIQNRVKGYGCPFCTNRAVNLQNCLATTHPELSKEWHPTKNIPLTPKDITYGSIKNIWWICNKNNTHEWKASANSRTSGNGCPICAGKIVDGQNCLAAQMPNLVKEWHPTKNGSLTPYNVLPGSHKKAWWLCNKNNNHVWETVIKSRAYGRGCPYCYQINRKKGTNNEKK